MAQITPGSAKGTVEFKGDDTITSTFTIDDGTTFTYNGSITLPPIYAILPSVCDAVLHYKTAGAPGSYTWTSKEGVNNSIEVTVNANDGNTIVINMPRSSFVKRSDPKVTFFNAHDAPSGSFALV